MTHLKLQISTAGMTLSLLAVSVVFFLEVHSDFFQYTIVIKKKSYVAVSLIAYIVAWTLPLSPQFTQYFNITTMIICFRVIFHMILIRSTS